MLFTAGWKWGRARCMWSVRLSLAGMGSSPQHMLPSSTPPYTTLPYVILPYPTLPCPILFYPALPYPALPSLALFCPASSRRPLPCPILPSFAPPYALRLNDFRVPSAQRGETSPTSPRPSKSISKSACGNRTFYLVLVFGCFKIR